MFYGQVQLQTDLSRSPGLKGVSRTIFTWIRISVSSYSCNVTHEVPRIYLSTAAREENEAEWTLLLRILILFINPYDGFNRLHGGTLTRSALRMVTEAPNPPPLPRLGAGLVALSATLTYPSLFPHSRWGKHPSLGRCSCCCWGSAVASSSFGVFATLPHRVIIF